MNASEATQVLSEVHAEAGQTTELSASEKRSILQLMVQRNLPYQAAVATVRAEASWELISTDTAGWTTTEMVDHLDAYDMAVQHEGWLARVTAPAAGFRGTDRGQFGLGLILALAATATATLGSMAWLGHYLQAVS